MPERIAFFDFDGTLTKKDTLLEFIKFHKGRFRFYMGMALNSPWLIAFKAKIISNQTAKERVLTHFFGKYPLAEFRQACLRFSKEALPQLIRPKALTEIEKLQALGAAIVVVSASPENWIQPWTEEMGLRLLASRLEIKDDRLTGKIMGNNCHGEEKLSRIKEIYDLSAYTEIYAYGDSSGDKPMLRAANRSFYKPFL